MTKQLSPDEKKYVDLATRYSVLKSIKKKTGSLYKEVQAQRKLVGSEFAARVDRIHKEAERP